MPPICRAIRQEREDQRLTQAELAGRLGKTQPHIQRWETGREPRLDEVRSIEKALGHDPGYLLRLAGYVDDPDSVEGAVRNDPGLTPQAREIVLAAYRGAVEISSRRR